MYLRSLTFIIFFLPFTALGANEEQTLQNETSIVVAGLFALAFLKLIIAGIIGYLWYRKSKYKKQKIVLDV